ncbi:hypothetical protein TTHERM_000092859 (macronuclear) [Tetrahymena thermophila SB210]|uniref:Uncharacterized protein n=1 Tax=Tetrahymena thermophila (strain SB210) TaxID=312017 RepID=W7XEN9_TETTS|nr:hypothetical protein TTHERM_000092859 [Tetrahymena thermophila SB210]EWS75188.1 hypothetical protein TTHERM_000092859 [Tetrahymena thermophila SB210]|eukprot:XP_012652179.1 hypothetical protein TTHERM_000092859 [Tetrahymena thermophila SB210]
MADRKFSIHRKSLYINSPVNNQNFMIPAQRKSILESISKRHDSCELKTGLICTDNHMKESNHEANQPIIQRLSQSQNKDQLSSSMSLQTQEDFQKEQHQLAQQNLSQDSFLPITSTINNNLAREYDLSQKQHTQQIKLSCQFSSLQSSPRKSNLYRQINNQLLQQTLSPKNKDVQQINYNQTRIKHLKKQEIMRYYGQMFKEVQLLRLQPQMQERKMTYQAFHQNDQQKQQNDFDILKANSGQIQHVKKKQNKRGLMYTNELWSEPYYIKILKTSQLDQIENKIKTEKKYQTVQESVNKLDEYFKSLADPQEDYSRFQGVFSRKKISLKQDDLLKNYIKTQVNYENQLQTQRKIADTISNNLKKPQQKIKHQESIVVEQQNSQIEILQDKKQLMLFQDCQKVEESPRMNQITSINKFLIKNDFKEEQNEDFQNNYDNDFYNDQNLRQINKLEVKPQQNLQIANQYFNQPQENKKKIKEFNLQLNNTNFFKSYEKKFIDGSQSTRNSNEKQMPLKKIGFETSRNNSLEQSTKSSPYFQSLKNSRTNSIYTTSTNMEKLELSRKNSEKIFQQTNPVYFNQCKRLYTEGSFLSQKQQIQPDSIIEKDHQKFRDNINYILEECQKIQNESKQIKSKINEKMKESQIYNQIQLKILRMKQQKQLLTDFNQKSQEQRDQIDQRRKEINLYQFVKGDNILKQNS